MKAEWGEAEKRALNEKLNHPQKLVKCPRCGSELVYEKRGNSIALPVLSRYANQKIGIRSLFYKPLIPP